MTHTHQHTPVDDFSDCHAGIVSTLKKMNHLPELVAAAKVARDTAQEVFRMFEDIVINHHYEEEHDLFPAVLASSQPGSERTHVSSMVGQLTQEHREVEAAWARLKSQVKAAAKGADAHFADQDIQALVTRYLAHANFEEQQFLPLSQEILGRNSNHLAALGVSLHMRHAKIPASYI
jgi:hemerythrin-like domain-containing protein